ncbi:reverse ribonuclease integrase, partial [Lasius niger]
QYDFNVKYRRGTLNRVADALSRQPEACAAAPLRCRWYHRLYDEVSRDPARRPDYRIEDGRLRRHILHSLNFKEDPTASQWKECVPKERRYELLQRYHDAPTAGHLGIAKTIARIAERYYWPGMLREITAHVRSCQKCQAHKAHQAAPAGTLHATNVQRPWEQVMVDLVGPLPRSRQGHTWLFVMQDRFTKWIELTPLRHATAKNTTRAVTEKVILRHGRPDSLVSDNGTQFTSAIFTTRLAELGIQHRPTPVYAPHCNPVERTNRTVKTMIGQFVEKDHRNWDENLPALQFAFNTAVHEATGYTPAFLNHGRELATPHPGEIPPATETRPHELHRQLAEAYEVVRINMARAFQRQEKYYNLRRREWRPRVGDWVWKRDHTLSNRANHFNAKLAPKFVGPLEVRQIISPVIVDLRSQRGKWYRHIHIQDLKSATKTPGVNKNKETDDESEGELPHPSDEPESEGDEN